ncbi:FtsW/RodA/SpoVE family cell cycle protein [Mycoplasma sp. P36-A1]|uniref:FtsW/RodA/SpoVE family cell cycle protein n=1 Tax=Mycoplasma sp. P36-A1 TaxID=3252900 RepID=UPI003C303355
MKENAKSIKRKIPFDAKSFFNIKAKGDLVILICVLLLVIGGYIMVASAHTNVFVTYGAGVFIKEMAKITVFIIVGFFIMQKLNQKFDIEIFKKYRKVFLMGISALMIMTLFFPSVNGSKSWINLGFMTIQPTEFLKMFVILDNAVYFSSKKYQSETVFNAYKEPLLKLLISVLFIFILQNDLGNALIIIMIYLVMFYAIPDPRIKKFKKTFAIAMAIFIILFYIFGKQLSDLIYSLPDDFFKKAQLTRIAVLFNPLKDVYISGFQVTNALVALASGGLFGMGLNNSTTKFLLPEAYNDAIIAVIAEELGLVGVLVLFILYIGIIVKLLSYAEKPKISTDSRLLLVGVAAFFMAQFFVNIGGMVGLIPMTGVTLLFVSSGGSSILMAFISIGIAQATIKRYLK